MKDRSNLLLALIGVLVILSFFTGFFGGRMYQIKINNDCLPLKSSRDYTEDNQMDSAGFITLPDDTCYSLPAPLEYAP